MFYRKNVGKTERVVRIVGGSLMIACGLIGLQGSALGWVLAASGIVTIVTGVVGYCPACAVAHRKSFE
jgi:hypothetical protein